MTKTGPGGRNSVRGLTAGMHALLTGPRQLVHEIKQSGSGHCANAVFESSLRRAHWKPGALEFAKYYASASIGQIACIRSPNGHLLIQITAVDRTGGRSEVEFRYEVRGHLDEVPVVSE
jgi:hypothetical protein